MLRRRRLPPLSGAARPNLYLYYLDVMRISMGWPLFVIGIVSVAYAAWRREAADILLLSYAVANFVVISSTTSEVLYYPRYSLPIIVVFAALSGRALADLAVKSSSRSSWAATFVLALCVAIPVGQSITTAYALSQPDTRTLAKRWFEANVPDGSKVLIEGGKISPDGQTIPLQDTREVLRRRIQYWSKVEPKQAKFLELRLSVHSGVGYELEYVRLNSIQSLDAYVQHGVEYFVVRPDSFTERLRMTGLAASSSSSAFGQTGT